MRRVLGHLPVRLHIRMHRLLTRLLRTARFARSLAHLPTSSREGGDLFQCIECVYFIQFHSFTLFHSVSTNCVLGLHPRTQEARNMKLDSSLSLGKTLSLILIDLSR